MLKEKTIIKFVMIVMIIMFVLSISNYINTQAQIKEQKLRLECDEKYGKDNWIGYKLDDKIICQIKNHPPVIEVLE